MAASSVKIGTPTLRLLVNALTKLQSLDGMAHDDTIWSFANVNMELTNLTTETCQLFRPALLNVIDLLKQLDAVGYALKELTASCKRKLKALKTRLQPSFLHCGIQMLPDVVLMHIFDVIMEQPDGTSEEIFRLSHVSSRFRSLTLACPRLWSRVSPDMPPNVVKTCLEHSEEALLTVDISVFRQLRTSNLNEFLRLVVRHSSRWKVFSFECSRTSPDTERPLQLSQSTGNCYLSNLEDLHLNCCDDESCGLCRAMDVLQTQEMPKLHSLHIACDSLSPTSLPRPLASIRIRRLDLLMRAQWDIRSLANVLAPLVNLVELSLDPYSYQSNSVNNLAIQDTDLTLPKLKCLRLAGFDLVKFSGWMRCCRTPRVEELHLRVGWREPVKEWLTAIPSGSFGSVKKLHFDRNMYVLDDGALDFWRLVSKFPGLEHLDVSARSCTFDSDLRHELSTNMPPLRSLTLRLAFPVADLSYFIDTLLASERWEQFKSFGSRREGWDTEQTEKLLEGKEVKWYE